MRVMVYKKRAGQRQVIVVPGKRAAMAPVSIRGANKHGVFAEVEVVVEAVELAEKAGSSAHKQ